MLDVPCGAVFSKDEVNTGRQIELDIAKGFAKRGLGLLLTGLILNIFRYVLPMLTVYAFSGEALYLNTFTFLFGVDILEFAGLAFLFFALAKKRKWKDSTLLMIAAVASVLGVTGILLSGVIFPEDGLSFVPMTILAAVIVMISGVAAHWYQKKKFLSTKPGRIVLDSILIMVMVISLIGQTQAAPLDLI